MARTTDFLSQTRGKLDEMFQTRQTDHGTFLVRNPKRRSTRRSEKQANMRCQMANAGANFRLFQGMLTEAFEGKNPGQNDYNIFVAVNYGKSPVFITKQESAARGCVLGNYQYSRGSLNPIGLGLDAGVLVTNLNLGSLVINANTTVAEFSQALMANNEDWEEDDQLTYFVATQWIDTEGVPRATMNSYRMTLSTINQTKLWNEVLAKGFATVSVVGQGNVLGMSEALNNASASYIHSRNLSDGSTQVSTQRMVTVSDILARYQGEEAMLASAASYGGITPKEVYLNPMNTLSDMRFARAKQ